MIFYKGCYISISSFSGIEIFDHGFRINDKKYSTIGGAKTAITAYIKRG